MPEEPEEPAEAKVFEVDMIELQERHGKLTQSEDFYFKLMWFTCLKKTRLLDFAATRLGSFMGF